MSVLEGLEPQGVFHYFEEICNIPHGSSDTDRISEYLVNFAKDRNLKYIQDNLGNVIIFKNGTKGYENLAPVILQGHMDMVCEKDKDSNIDFSKDAIKLCVEGNVIHADKTTLGGDDGIAIAYALALLDAIDGEINHPPLEAVFTVDEEIGMLGASGLDCSELKSNIMLNIDSEEEGILLCGCAGGITSTCHMPVEFADFKADDQYYISKITITNISGGHSGVEIHRQGANANKVLGRVLYSLNKKLNFCLVNINGGLKENAIPREAYAYIVYKDENESIILESVIDELNKILSNEYRMTDPDITINLEKIAESDNNFKSYMTKSSTSDVINLLVSLPNGVLRMSNDIEGLVQTSLSMGIMKTEVNEVICCFSVRSSVESEKQEIVDRLRCITEALGGYYEDFGEYPAWEYKPQSKLRELMIDTYENMYGKKPQIQAIHAGVECGIFAGKINNLDCVSFGPQIDDIHTTSECLYIDSVERTWKYILEVLKKLK